MIELYVAVNGKDTNPGTSKRPLATLAGARNALRALRKPGKSWDGAATVWIRGGTYRLAESLSFGAEDSGSKDAPVVFRAVAGEEVRISGGMDIPASAFRSVKDPAILARLSEEARGKVLCVTLKEAGVPNAGELRCRGFFLQQAPAALELFFDDAPMPLSRWPNEGYVLTGTIIDSGPRVYAPSEVVKDEDISALKGAFAFADPRLRRWQDPTDAWVHGFWCWDWADQYLPLKAIDAEKGIVFLAAPHPYGLKEGKRFCFLNLLEEIDRPGEWYVDRRAGVLYFWPPKPLAGARISVSVLETPLVTIDGARYLEFRDLIFECSRGLGVQMRDSTGCVLSRCTLRNFGAWAIQIGERSVYTDVMADNHGGQANGVRDCELSFLGEGGVILSGGDRRTLLPGDNFVEGCRIHHFGRTCRTMAAGVETAGVGNRVMQNAIHDAPHAGIFMWGNEQWIERNELFRLCAETSDAGAVYIGRDWTMRGNIVCHNWIHDLGRYAEARECNSTMAVYLDDCASGTTVTGNVIVDAYVGILIGGGHDNVVENNIFRRCGNAAILADARGLSWAAKMFNGGDPVLFDRLKAVQPDKPPYSVRYPALATLAAANPAVPQGNRVVLNIFIGSTPAIFGDGMNEAIFGFADNLTLTEDEAAAAFSADYHVKPGGPLAGKLAAFQVIPFEKIGCPRPKPHGNP